MEQGMGALRHNEGFTPEPLDDEFTCSVCLEDLHPALSFPKCLHKICGQCANQVGGQCPLCRERSEPRPDHTMTTIVQREMDKRQHRCNRCEALVDNAGRANHRCATEEQRLVERFAELALGAGVNRETLTLLVRAAIEENLDENTLLATIQAEALRAAPAPVASPFAKRATADAFVYIDFNQFGFGYSPPDVERFLSALMEKMIDDKLTAKKMNVKLIAFGVPLSFRDERMLSMLNAMQVQTRLVSVTKQEETIRQIEREALENESRVVVLVSSDEGFNYLARKLGEEGKTVVVVHNKPPGSSYSNRLTMFGSISWRLSDISPGFSRASLGREATACLSAQAVAGPTHPKPPIGPSFRSTVETSPPRTSGRSDDFFGFGTFTAWRADNGNPPFLFTSVNMNIDGKQQQVFLTANRVRGPPPSKAGLVSPTLVFIIGGPNPKTPERLSCVAAFPASWDVPVGGNLVPLSQLAPTQGLVAALMSRREVSECKYLPSCEKGLACRHVHRLGLADGRGEGGPKPIRIDGAMVPQSHLEPTAAVDVFLADSSASVKWCEYHPNCQKGASCMYAHYTTGDHMCVEGKVVHHDELEHTTAWEYSRAHPGSIIKWCQHVPSCRNGERCTYAHKKLPSVTTELTAINVEEMLIPLKDLDMTAAIDNFRANRLLVMKWCTHHSKPKPACNKGIHCEFAHSIRTAVRVDGRMVPIVSLKNTSAIEAFQRHPGVSLNWCSFARRCKYDEGCKNVHQK